MKAQRIRKSGASGIARRGPGPSVPVQLTWGECASYKLPRAKGTLEQDFASIAADCEASARGHWPHSASARLHQPRSGLSLLEELPGCAGRIFQPPMETSP